MDKTLPVAEIFCSPQGEGTHSGRMMGFIRLAGCTVGKPYSKSDLKLLDLQPYQERCVAWSGENFSCDTNYKMSKKMSIDEILIQVARMDCVCITGGEPLMHELGELIGQLKAAGKKIHIETSGTILLDKVREHRPLWVTVSPKQGYIRDVLWEASEIKVLVGDRFDESAFVAEFSDFMSTGKVWLQPINFETQINPINLQRCVELQHKYPLLRLSVQLHKVLGVR
jgi:7-carboxy-7-deazaguanine synthase